LLANGEINILLLLLLLLAGATKKNGEMFTLSQEMHAASIVGGRMGLDENIQVNGYVFIFDWTGFTTKHMTRWSIDDMRNWNNCWQV